jgi:hypothetical protein
MNAMRQFRYESLVRTPYIRRCLAQADMPIRVVAFARTFAKQP